MEVADAVVQSLRGELSSNTVNAPMVPPETLKELQPFITLAQGLGKTSVQLIAEHGFAGAHPAARPPCRAVSFRFVCHCIGTWSGSRAHA